MIRKSSVLLLCFASLASAQTTPNIGLNIPTYQTQRWDLLLNPNWLALDSYLSGVTPLPNSLRVTGTVYAANFVGGVTGNVTGNATGLAGAPNLNVGALTAQSVQIANNGPLIMQNSSGGLGRIAYVDVSNNYYFGDVSNLYSGNGFWMHQGSAALTFSASAITFNTPPVFGSYILNGSQSLSGVQGSTATKVLTASGTYTPGDCLNIAADGSAKDAGSGCGGGGGAVTSLTTTGSSGAATLAAGVLNVPVYTVSGVADINISIPSLTIGANTASPAYPASASTIAMPGATTSMVVVCGFSGDPVITAGWGQNGGLKISPWISSNGTVSYRIFNQTGATITSNATAVRCMAQ